MHFKLRSIECGVKLETHPAIEFAKVTFSVHGVWQEFDIPVLVPISHTDLLECSNRIYDDSRILDVARHQLHTYLSGGAAGTVDWKITPDGIKYDFVPPGWSQPE